MRLRPRTFPASLVVAALAGALGACSSSSPSADPPSAAATTEESLSTATYTVVAGDALSSIASRYGVSLDELVAANDWPDGDAHLILPGDSIRLPADAVTPGPTTTSPTQPSPTTARPAGSAATTVATGDATVGHYVALGTQYAGPFVGDQTLPVAVPLVDGVYEADAVAPDSPDGPITFTLYQVLYGDACRAVEGTGEDACLGDYGMGEGTATAPFDMANGSVSVIDDAATIAAYSIDVAEFRRLLAGRPAAADAPADYRYVPFPFTVTVRDGIVVAADQHFVS